MISALESAPLGDLAIFAVLFGFFIFGVLQGAIRSGLGSLAFVFAFLVSANLRDPLGNYLADNWHQFPADYDRMLAFLIIFLTLAIGATIVIDGFYKRVELSAAHPIVDDLAGGLMGLLQGLILLTAAVIILGSYQFPARFIGELDQVRWLHDLLLNQSSIGPGIRDHVVPLIFLLVGGLLPADLVKLFP